MRVLLAPRAEVLREEREALLDLEGRVNGRVVGVAAGDLPLQDAEGAVLVTVREQ